MKPVTIGPDIKRKYGNIKIAYLFVDGITIENTPPREKKMARAIEAEIRNEFSTKGIETDAKIQSWSLLSKKMGIMDRELYPAHIGLLESILSGRNIPKINNIVDAANIISAKYRCPVGVFDADAISSYVTLRVANEGENYLPLFSEKNVKVIDQEIVYCDAQGIFSRYCKDADRTKITEKTKSIFCVIDGTEETPEEYLIQARDELVNILKDVGGENLSISHNLIFANN